MMKIQIVVAVIVLLAAIVEVLPSGIFTEFLRGFLMGFLVITTINTIKKFNERRH